MGRVHGGSANSGNITGYLLPGRTQTNGPCLSWSHSATTNRITDSGFTYDAAGNLTADGTGAGTHTYQWDAEGWVKAVDNGATATYDTLGQNVQVGSAANAPGS